MSLVLTPNSFRGVRSGPVVTVVMDGIGIGPEYAGNAVRAAQTPILDQLMATNPWTPLRAHGTAVGLPSDADMGNSEVGHNALGSGQICDQGAKLVANALSSGSLFADTPWQEVIANVRDHSSTLHLIGLMSDGNVHSHMNHMKALIEKAQSEGVEKVAVHALIDGRDVGETSALDYIEPFETWLKEVNPNYTIASGGGRMVITMDRYGAEWGMVDLGWKTHVMGEGRLFPSASAAIKAYRAEIPGITDQNLPPFVIGDGNAIAPIIDGDSVILTNFRGDRAIEISQAFTGADVPFTRERIPTVTYAGMMQYDGDDNVPERFLVAPPSITGTMGEFLASNGVSQLACSETQKYGHVTYFWNGNRSGYFDNNVEAYSEIPSDVIPFEQRPWMKGAEITDEVIRILSEGTTDYARLNFANGDMVGHTGDFEAARISVEVVDRCLGRLLPVIKQLGGIALITADHGNADEMFELDKQGGVKMENGKAKAKTSHTLNPVPFIVYDPAFNGEYELAATAQSGLANTTATALNLLGYNTPEQYESSLVRFTAG